MTTRASSLSNRWNYEVFFHLATAGAEKGTRTTKTSSPTQIGQDNPENIHRQNTTGDSNNWSSSIEFQHLKA
ncbi:hypothetical protein VTH06DRAFT_6427 [Thermothelomyces fergusii]